MSENIFASMLRYARLKELPPEELQERVLKYKSAPENQTDDLRNEIIDGSTGIVARLVIGSSKRRGQWDHAVDSMQKGVLTAYEALESYKPEESPSFAGYLATRLRYMLIDDYRESLSVVKPGEGARVEGDLPMKGMLDDPGIRGAYLGEDPPDPEGSVLDILIDREAARRHDDFTEALGGFETMRHALLQFYALEANEKDQVRLDMGMGRSSFKSALSAMSRAYLSPEELLQNTQLMRGKAADGARRHVATTGERSGNEPEVPLSDELRSGFIALRQRKGLSIDEVVTGLAAEFNAAGIQRSAASAYTVLHSVAPPRQASMLASVVDALGRVYAPLPDVNYLPSDQPFQALRKKMVASAITHQDMQGISRKAGLKYTSDQVKGAYNFLSENRGAAPIVLVDEVLRQSSARPADAQGQAPVRRVLRHEGLI